MGNGPSFEAELRQIEEQADAELMRKYQRREWEMWVAPASDPLAMKKVNPLVSLSGSSFQCEDPREIAIGPVGYRVQFRQPAPIERISSPSPRQPVRRHATRRAPSPFLGPKCWRRPDEQGRRGAPSTTRQTRNPD
jgi:hypothetical protein